MDNNELKESEQDNAHLHKTQILSFVMRQLPAGPEPLMRTASL